MRRFVLLKERTRLYGEKQMYRGLQQPMPDPARIGKVRKSLARIKHVSEPPPPPPATGVVCVGWGGWGGWGGMRGGGAMPLRFHAVAISIIDCVSLLSSVAFIGLNCTLHCLTPPCPLLLRCCCCCLQVLSERLQEHDDPDTRLKLKAFIDGM